MPLFYGSSFHYAFSPSALCRACAYHYVILLYGQNDISVVCWLIFDQNLFQWNKLCRLVESAIEDLKKGKTIVAVDDENRENEGDLLMVAVQSRLLIS